MLASRGFDVGAPVGRPVKRTRVDPHPRDTTYAYWSPFFARIAWRTRGRPVLRRATASLPLFLGARPGTASAPRPSTSQSYARPTRPTRARPVLVHDQSFSVLPLDQRTRGRLGERAVRLRATSSLLRLAAVIALLRSVTNEAGAQVRSVAAARAVASVEGAGATETPSTDSGCRRRVAPGSVPDEAETRSDPQGRARPCNA